MPPISRIACWMSEKKLQKINWPEFEKKCRNHGFELFKLKLTSSLESQGPFSVLLHKLTDIIALANQNDIKSANLIKDIEDYLAKHKEVIVIDPIPKVRILIDRFKTYSLINETNLNKYGVFTPTFCDINILEPESMKQQLQRANVTYPFLAKPIMGHGSRQAHELSIIFNENSLTDCKVPCVAQSFIPHDATLYKVFIIGDEFYSIRRPSLKNFEAGDFETIHFDTSDVSKANSQNVLCILDPEDEEVQEVKPDEKVFAIIAKTLREAFGMDLLGVDVVIEKSTKRYAIIDVNSFPGYDGFPDYYEVLANCISKKF